jgi:hypothetical protein
VGVWAGCGRGVWVYVWVGVGVDVRVWVWLGGGACVGVARVGVISESGIAASMGTATPLVSLQLRVTPGLHSALST